MFKKLWNLLTSLFNKNKSKATETIKGWTEEQVHELVELYMAKASKSEIIAKTGRTLNSINAKLTDIFGSCKTQK